MDVPVVPTNLGDPRTLSVKTSTPWQQARRLRHSVFASGRYDGAQLRQVLTSTAKSHRGTGIDDGTTTPTDGAPDWNWVRSDRDWLRHTEQALWKVVPDLAGGPHAVHFEAVVLGYSNFVLTATNGSVRVLASPQRHPSNGELFDLTPPVWGQVPHEVQDVLHDALAGRVLAWQDPWPDERP